MLSYALFPLLFLPVVLYKAFFVPEPIPCTYYKVVHAGSDKSAVVVSHDMNCATFFQNYTVRFIRHMARYMVDYESYVIFDYDDIANILTCRINTEDVEGVQCALQADTKLMCEHERYLDYTDEDDLQDRYENGSNISEDDSVELDSLSDEPEAAPCPKSVLSSMFSKHMGSVQGIAVDTIFEAIYAVKNKAALFKRKGFPSHVKHLYMQKLWCREAPNPWELVENERALLYIRKVRICLKSELDKPFSYPFDTSGLPYDTILYTKDGKWFAVFGTEDSAHDDDQVNEIKEEQEKDEDEIVLVQEDETHQTNKKSD